MSDETVGNACPGRARVLAETRPGVHGPYKEPQPHESAGKVEAALQTEGAYRFLALVVDPCPRDGGFVSLCKHCGCFYWEPA